MIRIFNTTRMSLPLEVDADVCGKTPEGHILLAKARALTPSQKPEEVALLVGDNLIELKEGAVGWKMCLPDMGIMSKEEILGQS